MKPKMEFSKKILLWTATGTILVVIFACIMAWRTKDMSVFAYLIPSVFAELAVGTGFYYRKAQAENTIRIEKGVDGYGQGCEASASGSEGEMPPVN